MPAPSYYTPDEIHTYNRAYKVGLDGVGRGKPGKYPVAYRRGYADGWAERQIRQLKDQSDLSQWDV